MRHRRERAHSAGLFGQLLARVVGRGEALISAGDELPLVLARYPRGSARLVDALRGSVTHTFSVLPSSIRGIYRDVLARATPVVIADLRRRNACTCLGHHHPSWAHSGFARAFARDMGGPVGEIDLAIDAIRDWEPLPLSGLAAEAWTPDCDPESKAEFTQARFHIAVLSVFLHELEHLGFPEHSEQQVRERSNTFYSNALRALLAQDFGLRFGITSEAAA